MDSAVAGPIAKSIYNPGFKSKFVARDRFYKIAVAPNTKSNDEPDVLDGQICGHVQDLAV